MKVATITSEQALKELKTSREGLSVVEVEKRLKRYGANVLPTKSKKGLFLIILNQFKSPLVYILLIAAVVSFATGEIGDGVIILIVLLINASVGYYQEAKAENTLYTLRQILPQEALVKRDGGIKKVLAHKLVPGDIIILRAGDKVVADVKVVSSVDLSVNEAFLTGESRPVKKEAILRRKKSGESTSIVYAGSIILYGEGEAVVVSTGQQTRIGGIAKLVKDIDEGETPLQKRIKNLANTLVLLLIVIIILIFILGISAGYSYKEMVGIAIALAVSAIPEGLLIAITVILAIGMQRILQRKALVKRLLAAETLGGTSVICTDKTGTLTVGAMKVTKLVTYDGETKTSDKIILKNKTLLRMVDVAVYCNDALIENYHLAKEQWKLLGRPTDRSLLQFALDLSIPIEQKRNALPRLTFIPFNSTLKYMATLNAVDKKSGIMFVKGAPEKILSQSSKLLKNEREVIMTDSIHHTLIKKSVALSSNGYRVLAAAYKSEKKSTIKLTTDEVQNLVFIGFYIIEDPVRPETAETIKEAKRAGITTVMITGDHPKTAFSIAKQLHLTTTEEAILTGEELEELSDKQLFDVVESVYVYARVAPEHKMRIVDAWQKHGHVVAMTGDGINDAPALKKADVGIAIGSGTEVAKEAADLVLLDDNFKTIVAAIAEGRVIFANVIKVSRILLSGAFSGLLVITTSLIIGIPLPLLAVQILWKNVITDGLPDIALAAEPPEENILDRKPISQRRAIVNFQDRFFIVFLSISMAAASLLSFIFIYKGADTLDHARTLAFTVLVFVSLLSVYSVRDLKKPIWKRSLFDNPFLIYSILAGIVLQVFVIYTPILQRLFETVSLGALDWTIVIGASVGIILLTEGAKALIPKLVAEQ